MSTKLGRLLVEEGLLSEQDRKTIQEASGSAAGAFAKGILALGLLGEDELAAFIADRTQYSVAAKDIFAEVDDRALGAIDTPLLRQLEVIPLRLDSGVLAVAMIDPLDRATIHQLEFFTGCKIKPLIATLKQVRMGLSRLIPGYAPEPSAFETFMETHMRVHHEDSAKTARAKELIARVTDAPAPVVAKPIEPDVGDTNPPETAVAEPAVEEPAAVESADADAAAPETSEAESTPTNVPETMADETSAEPTVDSEAATTDGSESDAAQPTDSDEGDSAGDTTSDQSTVEAASEAGPLKPDFGTPPALAGNETAANKALLTLNKRAMDVSVDADPAKALNTLVAALFEIGLQNGSILIRHNGALEENEIEAASWHNQETAGGVALKAPPGSNANEFVDAVANYAPESMDSDGWLQIKAEDVPAVSACLDLIDAGADREAIESGLTTNDTALLARAFKMTKQDVDMIAVLNWSMETAGHEALRASVSNALRAFAQKIPKK